MYRSVYGISCIRSKLHVSNHKSTKNMICMLTCVSPGEGAGCGTDTGPVIGCGGLFISCAFVGLHQAGAVLPEYLETVAKTYVTLLNLVKPK